MTPTLFKTRLSATKHLPVLAAALAVQALAGAALAETYTVSIADLDIGLVTSAVSGNTVFRVDPGANTVFPVSGSGTRVSSGGARGVVTVSCAASAPGDCTKLVNVRLAVTGAPTNRQRTLTRLLYAMGTAQFGGDPSGYGPGNFTIQPIGPNASKTFYIGADLTIAGDESGLPTGDSESGFSVFVAPFPAVPTQGGFGRARARVLRSITLSKTSDLVFGKVTLPPSGSGVVTLDPGTGAVSTTGGIVSLGVPNPTRATFNVTGEGGQTFSISMPATFQMTGTTTPLTVTTTNSAGASGLLSAGLGAQGAFAFGVGGSFTLANTTKTGDYTGNFTVTVAYN